MRHSVTLYSAQQGHTEFRTLWEFAKPWLVGGHRLTATIETAKRTLDQNAKFHAICGNVEKSGFVYLGKPRSLQQWKVLFVSGHAIATNEGAEMVPGLEGEFVNLRESTAQMLKDRKSSLIEYTLAWCAMNGVKLQAPEEVPA
jgi:hypothetical protein